MGMGNRLAVLLSSSLASRSVPKFSGAHAASMVPAHGLILTTAIVAQSWSSSIETRRHRLSMFLESEVSTSCHLNILPGLTQDREHLMTDTDQCRCSQSTVEKFGRQLACQVFTIAPLVHPIAARHQKLCRLPTSHTQHGTNTCRQRAG